VSNLENAGSCARLSNFRELESCVGWENLTGAAKRVIYLYLYFPFYYNINLKINQVFIAVKKYCAETELVIILCPGAFYIKKYTPDIKSGV